MTLHKNCRNTQEIARTSVTPLKDKKNKAIKPSIANELEVGKDGYDRYKCNGVKYPVTTCIKFKGLEADGIIMM